MKNEKRMAKRKMAGELPIRPGGDEKCFRGKKERQTITNKKGKKGGHAFEIGKGGEAEGLAISRNAEGTGSFEKKGIRGKE